MEANATEQLGFHNLPPELLKMIFEYSDATTIAKNRAVCANWRNTIESIHTTRLDMNKHNWGAFIMKSTASKICLKIKGIQLPIYLAPEFKHFMARVNTLELTGHIPEYNVTNILKECRRVKTVYIHHVKYDAVACLLKTNTDRHDFMFELRELSIGKAGRDERNLRDLLIVTNYVGSMLKFNCLKILNFSEIFKMENILQLIFPVTFDAPTPNKYEDKVIKQILDEQRQSLRLITFYTENLKISRTNPRCSFIVFHPYSDASVSRSSANSTNYIPQIDEAHLYPAGYYGVCRGLTRLLFKIFETQFRMKNLEISYFNQADVDRIENIIKNNCATLEEITITSMEKMEMEDSFRSISCSWFATCLTLKKLTLCSDYTSRKVKLLDLLLLPTSLKKLFLNGFAPTGSPELLAGSAEPPQYPELTEVMLGALPWFFQDENPVITFEKAHLFLLLNLLPEIRKLTLREGWSDDFWLDASMTDPIPLAVSSEFVTWCRQGGGDNVEIASIQISGNDDNSPLRLLGFSQTVHEILIGNNQH